MTYSEALSYIHRTDWKGSVLGLSRIRRLLSLLGDPQSRLRFVHVAGTNGKGSVCAFLSSVLSECGYRVGVFTSPFLSEFRERIRIGDTLISEQELCEAVEAVRPAADSMSDAPTEFELMTALAFWYFEKQGCDLVVCEVGLGGELDSTNVIETVLVSVITTIALDHTRELGGTLSDIAAAKAGILKPAVPVVFGQGENAEALAVIKRRAEALSCPLRVFSRSQVQVTERTLCGSRFSVPEYGQVAISLLGAYQPYNAAASLCVLSLLREQGLAIAEAPLRRGMLRARWAGRFELLSQEPLVLFDGAHNPHGALALLESLDACFPAGTRFVGVCAVMGDKDYPALFDAVFPRLAALHACAPSGHARALSAKTLSAVGRERGLEATPYPSVEACVRAAYRQAREQGLPLLIFGSLYLYREAAEAVALIRAEGR